MAKRRSANVRSPRLRIASHRRKSRSVAHSTEAQHIAAALAELEAKDSTGILRKKRNEFLQQLENAKQKDQSAAYRREQAKGQAKTASALSKLAKSVQEAKAHYIHAVLKAVYYAGLWPHDPEHIAGFDELGIKELNAGADWLVNQLRERKAGCREAAQYYRRLTTEKSDQWGPATHRTIESIIRLTERTFLEILAKRDKPKQQAEYYAGLLCFQRSLLPRNSSLNANTVSDQVRKRLDRGVLFVRAVEEHEARFPTTPRLSRTLPDKVTLNSWFASRADRT